MPVANDQEELRDINERLLISGLREHELAAELSRQLAFTNAIARSLGEGLCALDRSGRITYANPSAAQLLGWQDTDLIGKNLHTLIHVDCDDNCQLLGAVQQCNGYRNDDDAFMRADGGSVPVAYSVAPVANGDSISGVVIAFRNITDRKRLLHQEQVARTMAEDAVKIRSELMETVVHDLQNPLTIVKATAHLIGRRIDQDKQVDPNLLVKDLEQIDLAALRIMAMLTELLDMAHLQMGKALRLDHSPADLVIIIQKAIAGHRTTSHHPIEIQSEASTLTGVWDASRLERVLNNLISNADKFSTSDQPIIVRLTREPARNGGAVAVLSVEDDGVGIPISDLPRVFERFYRGQNIVGSIAGTGLGLAGSKEIIEQHGGTIDIDSAEGSGTTVTIRLPCD